MLDLYWEKEVAKLATSSLSVELSGNFLFSCIQINRVIKVAWILTFIGFWLRETFFDPLCLHHRLENLHKLIVGFLCDGREHLLATL